MTIDVARASHDWLTLREPADADARSRELVEVLAPLLPKHRIIVHDLGCGTGSMRRWLSPLLPQEQHWIEHDRDVDLLWRDHRAETSSSGRPVTHEARESDITRLSSGDLRGAHLTTASALLDMFTLEELTRFVDICLQAGCPSLLTLSVVGRVRLDPADALDPIIAEAFNDHQRRAASPGTLLGPDAAAIAVQLLSDLGAGVVVRSSPWLIDAKRTKLLGAWLDGWAGAACEQRPELLDVADSYQEQRRDQIAEAGLRAHVDHVDILVLP